MLSLRGQCFGLWSTGKMVLHATEALHNFRVTCNISISGGVFGKVVPFHFSVEIDAQQTCCKCFVPGSLVQRFENCVRIGILCLLNPVNPVPSLSLRAGALFQAVLSKASRIA